MEIAPLPPLLPFLLSSRDTDKKLFFLLPLLTPFYVVRLVVPAAAAKAFPRKKGSGEKREEKGENFLEGGRGNCANSLLPCLATT